MTSRTEWCVCMACGWVPDDAGWLDDGPPMVEHIDEIIALEHMSYIMQALTTENMQINVMWSLAAGWRAYASNTVYADEAFASYDMHAGAPTPHEAVFALAEKIGRAMEVRQ